LGQSDTVALYTHYLHLGLKMRIWVGSSALPPKGVFATSASDNMGISDNLCVERTCINGADWIRRSSVISKKNVS
jgi:hypothetical protein